jgi:hypothetical protein
MAILEFLAEGHRPKDISETLGVPVSVVYNAKKNHKYVIAEIQGKKPDGSPARFAPGCGAETIAKMERVEEEETAIPRPAEMQQEEPRKHSIAELFQEIDALKAERSALLSELDARKKRITELHETLDGLERKAKGNEFTICAEDFIKVLYEAYRADTDLNTLMGYISCYSGLEYFGNKRKEEAKNV